MFTICCYRPMSKITETLQLLRTMTLFQSLSDDDLKINYENAEEVHYSKDSIIQEPHDISNSIACIQEGAISVTKGDGKEERLIAEYIEGESYGEMNIMFPKITNATIKASKDSVIIMFPKKNTNFISFKEKYGAICSQIYYNQLAFIATRIRHVNSLVAEKTGWIQDLKNQLLKDKLTGLYNTTFLNEDFKNELANYGKNTTFIMIKPDKFKLINDSCGHEIGDQIIQNLAHELKLNVKKDGICVRYRGNENAVILPDFNYEAGIEFAKKLCKKMMKVDLSETLQDFQFTLTFSMSVATYPKHAQKAEGLIEKGFELLYKAIEKGGNGICTPEMENCQ